MRKFFLFGTTWSRRYREAKKSKKLRSVARFIKGAIYFLSTLLVIKEIVVFAGILPDVLKSDMAQPSRLTQRQILSLKPSRDYINNIAISPSGSLFLTESAYKNQKDDPRGYLQVDETAPPNFYSCVSLTAHSNALNFSYRLDHEFSVIFGDGDLRAIGLKVDGTYVQPDPDAKCRNDAQGRCLLDIEFPKNEKFSVCLAVSAPLNGDQKKVKAEVNLYDSQGRSLNVDALPKWTIQGAAEKNTGSHSISLGLIDSMKKHPEFAINGLCTIEMKDKGNTPSGREKSVCMNP